MAWRQGCMGSMNMQCELNLYSTFLKKVLFQQLRVYPSPTNSGQDTKQIPRSSEGGDKPHPYVGCVLQMSYYQRFAEKLGMVSGFCHFPSRMSEPALCSGVAV